MRKRIFPPTIPDNMFAKISISICNPVANFKSDERFGVKTYKGIPLIYDYYWFML